MSNLLGSTWVSRNAADNPMGAAAEKRRSFVALLFPAGDAERQRPERSTGFMRSLMRELRRKQSNSLNHSNNRLVNFVICGTGKGGTSALDAYLREHLQICMADEKEVHFFDNESFFDRDRPDYSKYHSFFNPRASHRVIGEATPAYMYRHAAPRRMWEYNPSMKLIVVLRNPIDRAYSHWNMQRSRKLEKMSFWDAILNEQQRCREALPYQHPVYSYVDRGFYLEQLRRLWFYFSKGNVLVLKNEHLRDQPRETLQGVCGFLDIDDFDSVKTREVHARPYSTKMSDREKEYLRSLFEYEIKGIERVLGWDCSNWLSG